MKIVNGFAPLLRIGSLTFASPSSWQINFDNVRLTVNRGEENEKPARHSQRCPHVSLLAKVHDPGCDAVDRRDQPRDSPEPYHCCFSTGRSRCASSGFRASTVRKLLAMSGSEAEWPVFRRDPPRADRLLPDRLRCPRWSELRLHLVVSGTAAFGQIVLKNSATGIYVSFRSRFRAMHSG